MLYIDTSVMVKLYVKEIHSFDVSRWIKKNNEAIPLTGIHELEFVNAINLKRYRSEISEGDIRLIMTRFTEHELRGVYYRPQIDWADIFNNAVGLSKTHTAKTASRSLDILHVASALSIRAEQFMTFDNRQSELASIAGLRIIKL
ncbi:MAG: type II toxin-antitoxin system VapC family toxin [Thermodesulfobacteriota bacterium]|nr:type II toxin-antitoxin system VapC family toxin [Thermodesulfobacteriota bacterium]